MWRLPSSLAAACGDDKSALAACFYTHASRAQVLLRLRGGGGDGGATGAESRSSYLEMYKTQATGKLDAREEQLATWTCCRLTRQPLGGEDGTQAVVACQLGYLFNREPVLHALKERLLDGVPLPAPAAHIGSLKDLTTLKLSSEGAGAAAVAADASDFRTATHVRFACPLTGLQMNGRCRFVALRPSGVVVSERAFKTVPEAVAELLDGQPLSSQAVLPINGTAEEVDTLRVADAATKAKKAKKQSAKIGVALDAAPKRLADDAPAAAKKYKASDHLPAGATPDVYASIFTSSSVAKAETFGARALSFRR